ncbi:F0F1 ATP synthase subunit epsilon [Auraticoccus monumenti]|uniref:ATP synthase epsilon chain n=1 Tax=Auraticoccus monumenti TaxID=675864 RepID=A0A1G7AY94_9ACTN|nr:F0F1 ATP synthase subunit epsilon [Auraticoccus monumenti]SDE19763.1 F-type H+-transporting ATPase subunit epsilon [Auraticoccus monumenti]
MAEQTQGVLRVEVVSADRSVWSGEARSVTARTTEGDIGILPGHSPVLGVLVPSGVEILTTDGQREVVAVDGGFVSVAQGRVSILSEYAAMGGEIDAGRARTQLDELLGRVDDHEPDVELEAAIARARAQVAAAERAR